MATHEAVDVDPKQLKDANKMWARFVKATKYSVYAIVALLIALALAFVEF